MPGLFFGRGQANQGAPTVRDYDVAVSQSIQAGDWVVLTGVGAITRCRKLLAADITNNYTETVVKGLLGMAMHDIVTDASGNVTGAISPSTVAVGARAVYPLPTYGAGVDADPVTNTGRLLVALADSNNEFLIRIQAAANANATVTPNLVSSLVGMQIYNTVDFAANTAASGAGLCAIVTGVDEQDKNYNTASPLCRAYVKILPAYQQSNLGTLYLA